MWQALRLAVRTSVAIVVAATLLAAGLVVYARSQGMLLLSVQSGSMRPSIRPGDAVVVRQSSNDISQLKIGDIISYHSRDNPNVIITHRVVSIDRVRQLITAKGDNLPIADPAVSMDRVIGNVERTVPVAGYAFNFIRHPLGLVAATYVPAAIMATSEVRRLVGYYKRQRYQVYYY